MEFEKGDYLINIDKLKAKLFDELVEGFHGNDDFCVEVELQDCMNIIATIEKYGQKME